MQHGIVLTTGDARTSVELAVEAEAAGWDGVFTWDAIAIGGMDILDPWALLGAIAVRTERVRLGAMVFAPSRRRPWTLLKEAVTIDHLSGGRLVLPVGLGALDDAGFGTVGEATEARVRASRLDETLAIIDGLQRDEPFAYLRRALCLRGDVAAAAARPAPTDPGVGRWRLAARAVDAPGGALGRRGGPGPRRGRRQIAQPAGARRDHGLDHAGADGLRP